jgi:leader peptidase (prepilin peptidase)/N-methyltransferase
VEPLVLIAALFGGLLGAAADRLAARWPAHPDGVVRRVDWRTAAVIGAGALAFGGLAARWPEPRDLVVLGVWFAALVVLLATDLDQRLLPDAITLPLIPYALVVVLAGIDPLLAGKELALPSALAAAVGAPIVLLVTDRLFGGALGMGDVKLAVSLGLMTGVSRLVVGFLLASAASSVVLLLLIATRRISLRSAIPFGPILIAGGIVAALLPG